jgi:hypothetical protein
MEFFIYDLNTRLIKKITTDFKNLKYNTEKEKNMIINSYCKSNNYIRLTEEQVKQLIIEIKKE